VKQSMQDDPKATTREDRCYVEKFTYSDLMTLRSELLHGSVDSFQAAEIVSNFLSGRGYGVCSQEARKIATSFELHRATAETMQAELERVARVM
jgi:hypothetical protein